MSLNLDKSKWSRVTFGEVVQNVNETVRDAAAAGIERIVAMEHLDPGELKVSRWGTTDDETTFTRLVKPTQTLFGKRRAYQRKVAYAEFEAICSGDILTFEVVNGRMLPEFLPFLVQSDGFFDHALGTSAGSLSPRTSWRDLSKYAFDLPPLDEQRRIADLLWAVERHRRSLTALSKRARDGLSEMAERRLGALPTTVKLGSVAAARSGPSFSADDVHDSPRDGDVPVIGIPNTKPDGTIDLAAVSFVTGLRDTVRTVSQSSLVLIRTNGNRQRIGNVYLPPVDAHGHAVSAFQFLLDANDSADREYLFWTLFRPSAQAQMSGAASGTVGLGNLAVRWLDDYAIPWHPSPAERHKVVNELRDVAVARIAVDAELSTLNESMRALSTAFFGDLS